MKEIYIHYNMITSVFGGYQIQWCGSRAVSLLSHSRHFLYSWPNEKVKEYYGNDVIDFNIINAIRRESRTKFCIG